MSKGVQIQITTKTTFKHTAVTGRELERGGSEGKGKSVEGGRLLSVTAQAQLGRQGLLVFSSLCAWTCPLPEALEGGGVQVLLPPHSPWVGGEQEPCSCLYSPGSLHRRAVGNGRMKARVMGTATPGVGVSGGKKGSCHCPCMWRLLQVPGCIVRSVCGHTVHK